MKDAYIRSVQVVRVIDGDTVVVDVDLGFYVSVRMSCRLVGINAVELTEPRGREARDYLALLLSQGAVTVHSVKADKFAGRFDAIVQVAGPASDVNQLLIDRGYAVAWDGKGPKPPVPQQLKGAP